MKTISFMQVVVFTGKRELLGKSVKTSREQEVMLHLNPETGLVAFDSGAEYVTVPNADLPEFVKLAKANAV